MPSLLSYIRPFRYDRVSRIVLVETGPSHLVAGVLEELDRLFPDAHTEVLLREEDAFLASELKADRVHVVRFEERADLDIHAIPQNPIEPAHLHHDLRFLFSARSMPGARAVDVHDLRWVELDRAVALNPEPAMKRILMKLAVWPAIPSQEEV